MKTWNFLVFFSIVLIVYFLINYYIFKRGLLALSEAGIYRTLFFYFFLFLAISYPAGRILEQFLRNSVSKYLIIIGAFYLAVMIYAFLFIVIVDIFRLGNHFLHFFPAFITKNYTKSAEITTYLISAVIILIVLAGHINTLYPRVRTLNITIKKPANSIQELSMAVVSDIHLGTIIQDNHLNRIVNKVNRIKPDIVFMPGDIVDEDVAPIIEQNMIETLRKIKSKYGVFAVTGNHEYFSGVNEAVSYMEKAGIQVLQDEYIKISDAFYIIGRKDRMAGRMGNGRKPLKEIIAGIDPSYPLILMDHQPLRLEEALETAIDLQLSGHTHHGQLFPVNLITQAVYELSWGYLKKENTNYYVSCGVGTWGPPVRTTSVPEIVHIKLKFTGNEKYSNQIMN